MKQKLFNIVVLLAIVASISSCRKPYATIDYTVVCSELLLQHAIPCVNYTNKDGQLVTMELSAEYWQDGNGQDSNNFTYTYVTGADNSAKKHWKTPTIKFEDFSIANSEISVTFKPKPEVAMDSTIMLGGELYHEVVYNVSIRDEDGDMHNRPDKHTTIMIVDVQPIKKLNLVEHINGLRIHYEIHVESNGLINVDGL